MDQEEENEWDMILKNKKEKQLKLGVERGTVFRQQKKI